MELILTDTTQLKRVSEPVNLDSTYLDDVRTLVESMPSGALGLSAPQIGDFHRFFVARLSKGTFVFINPTIEYSEGKHTSTESCLSLPGIIRNIMRYTQVVLNAKIFKYIGSELISQTQKEMTCIYKDACIVQHEYDHLDGVLITDHSESEPDTKILDKYRKRRSKIEASRQARKLSPLQFPKKKSSKNEKKSHNKLKKLKKLQRKEEKREKIRVEIQERYKANKKGLFDD